MDERMRGMRNRRLKLYLLLAVACAVFAGALEWSNQELRARDAEQRERIVHRHLQESEGAVWTGRLAHLRERQAGKPSDEAAVFEAVRGELGMEGPGETVEEESERRHLFVHAESGTRWWLAFRDGRWHGSEQDLPSEWLTMSAGELRWVGVQQEVAEKSLWAWWGLVAAAWVGWRREWGVAAARVALVVAALRGAVAVAGPEGQALVAGWFSQAGLVGTLFLLGASAMTLARAKQGQAERAWGNLMAFVCTKCGYDLRGTPGRCPECGTVVPDREEVARRKFLG